MGAVRQHAEAWTEFWQDQGGANGCCANAPEILAPIGSHWLWFARSLPPGAKVLDLGCGTGVAGQAMVNANPALRVTGIDFAAVPPADDVRIEILPSTRMECLPLADSSFDAAISQFGFEYGRIEKAACELARVLRPGAPFSFLVHHKHSPVASDAVAHRKVVQAIVGAEFETAFLSGDARALDRQGARIRQLHPHERIIDDAVTGLRRLIGQGPAQRAEIWRAVVAALAPELVMLAELERSAVSPEAMHSWLRPLRKGFDLRRPEVLTMMGGQLLCWLVMGVRKEG